MKKKAILAMIGILLSLVFSMITVSAAKDFSLSPVSFTQSANLNEAGSGTITITNNGTETINLTFGEFDLKDGTNTIALNLNKNSYDNLGVGGVTNVGFSYTTQNTVGTFTGNVLISDGTNTKQVPITLTVTDNVEAPSITFKDWGSSLEMVINVDDSSERETFYLVNNGNATLYDIEIDLESTFDGDNDNIDDNDFEINGEPGDDTYKIDDEEGDGFELAPGEEYRIKLDLDIPSNLDVDDYKGDIDVSYATTEGGSRTEQTFRLKVIAESDNDDVIIDQNSLYVKNGILKIIGEPGENINDYDFIIINDASYDVDDLILKLDGDLENEDGVGTMPMSAIKFDPNPFDIYDRDEETIDIEVDIPDNQEIGTYVADIELYSSTDKQLDKITLKIEVVGDIYVQEINFPTTVKPGDKLDVDIITKNQGTKIYRNVKVYATLFDVDYGNSDIYESSPSFILDVNEEKTTSLRFSIPDDASDGEHTLEIRIRDDDGNEIIELEEIDIVRPSELVEIQSYAINPPVITCDTNEIYTYVKFQNLGKYDEEVTITSEIEGTNIKETSSKIDLGVDDIASKNFILDVSSIVPGTYTVIQKIQIVGGSSKSIESTLVVNDCSDGGIVIVPPVNGNETNQTQGNETGVDANGINIDDNINNLTIYLAVGLGILIILIVLGLFLL